MKINLLMQQLAEEGGGEERPLAAKRIRSLEKEVHYYKKLCKELRTRREEEADISARDVYSTIKSPDRDHSAHSVKKSPTNEAKSPQVGRETHHSTRGPQQSSGGRNRADQGHERSPRRGARQEGHILDRIEVAEEREEASDSETSAVSQIQPSHIAQFQRRLARLHR